MKDHLLSSRERKQARISVITFEMVDSLESIDGAGDRSCPLLPLPEKALYLVQQYAKYRQLPDIPSQDVIEEQVEEIWHSLLDNNCMNYTCLYNGGFLRPTVTKHPYWKTVKGIAQQLSFTCVLDVGCGLGGDARVLQMELSSGCPGLKIVGSDRCSLLMKLGCKIFGDCDDHNIQFLTGDATDPDFCTILHERVFDIIYAGKFLHCFDTKGEVSQVLSNIHSLLSKRSGIFFGVYGRNPPWIYSDRVDFEDVMNSEGFKLIMIEEEATGGTWFAATIQSR